jgi:hypothetical protein
MVWAGNLTQTDEKKNHAKFWKVNLDRDKFEDLGIYGNIREITREGVQFVNQRGSEYGEVHVVSSCENEQ